MSRDTSRDQIPVGFDFLQTLSEGAVFHFSKIPIPAGFFAPTSHAFTKTVKFKGRPLSRKYFGGLDITHVDTVVERKKPAEVPPPYPSSAVVPIELVGLAL